MFITETWTPKYSYEPFPRSSGKGGGIGILYKNSLSSVLHFADKKQPVVTFETAIATLSISTCKITFVCIYRPPPSKNNKLKTSDFLCEFEEFLSSYDIKNKDTVFLGDFNVHFETENPDAIFMKNLLHDRLDSSVDSGFASWPRGRGFKTQPSTVQAPTGWVGVSIM
ncbi:reverse transcriptase-like protein [Elysia marginata]|uniref:Reverse transcriptase-like protein n=1 Tax=Elysia marginata TaxID=1093978 RepID=A0AAV4G9P8_9GAST|nr:reverse transcriptase-like protein [Elysia marginata]